MTARTPDMAPAAPIPIDQYEPLLACYRSNQISERQWTDHLRDDDFAAYVRRVSGGAE